MKGKTKSSKTASIVLLAVVVSLVSVTPAALAEYDPTHGRFLQRDPIGYRDGGNLYEYARSTPTYYVDPLGLQSTPTVTTQPTRKRHETPETFDVIMGNTEREGISTGVTVRYTPTPEQKRCCNTILLIQTAETEIIREGARDINKPPHIDARKKGKHKDDEQPWPFYPVQTPGGCDGPFGKGQCELSDDPGYRWKVQKLSQSFETCAVCEVGILSGVNFGCTRWGHYKNKGQPLKRWGAEYAKPPEAPSQTFQNLMKQNGLPYRYKK